MEKFDAVVIGFGKGGKTLAGKLAGSGKKVAVVEKSDRMYGGTCINVGCIPSKSLVRSAGLSRLQAGLSFEEKAGLYEKAVQEKRRLTGMLRKKNFDKLDSLENVTLLDGTASFRSPSRIEVRGAQGVRVIEGEQVFINTGSVPVLPPIEGLAGNPYVYTSETLMELDRLPRRLAIIGGGYIGLEFASIYADFGAEVTVYQDAAQFLPREDADMAEEIRGALAQKGIGFRLGVRIDRISAGDGHAVLSYTDGPQQRQAEAEAVLVATGRRPNTQQLGAQEAGIRLTERGAVWTDEGLRTSAPGVWAMGDVTGGLQFTYISLDDSRIVLSQLGGGSYTTAQRRNVPYSVFITPSYSRVGLSEKEALEAGYEVRVAKLPAAAIPKAQVLGQPAGLLKAVVDARTNKILGAMLFCEESYEMINIVKLAMDLDADYTVLRDQIFTHPTMSEALNDLFAAL